MEKKSEIIVKASMCEMYVLEDLDIREVNLDGNEFNKRLFIKIDGVNNKSNQKEQIQIYLTPGQSEDLARGLNEVIKKGLFE